MTVDARHICLTFHEPPPPPPPDWLNQFWQLGDWPAVESLGEQVFGLIALTEASVRRRAPRRLQTFSCPLCVCVSFSVFGTDGSDRDDARASPRGG